MFYIYCDRIRDFKRFKRVIKAVTALTVGNTVKAVKDTLEERRIDSTREQHTERPSQQGVCEDLRPRHLITSSLM